MEEAIDLCVHSAKHAVTLFQAVLNQNMATLLWKSAILI